VPTTSRRSIVRGRDCQRCGAPNYDTVGGRAKCVQCGAIYRRAAIESNDPATWDESRDIYVRRQRRKESDASEEAHAARFGGRRVRGSGSGNEKDDVVIRDERHEMKETGKNSISLKLPDWLKVRDSARSHGQQPALILTFKRALGRDVELVVMDIDDYEDLKRRAHEVDEHR